MMKWTIDKPTQNDYYLFVAIKYYVFIIFDIYFPIHSNGILSNLHGLKDFITSNPEQKIYVIIFNIFPTS